MPKVGETFKAGSTFGTIESTKTVSDLYMPVTGKVTAVNVEVLKRLEGLANDPYVGGWLVKLDYQSEDGELFSASEYETYIINQE